MRWAKLGLIGLTMVLAPVGLVASCHLAELAQNRAAYEKYELLRTMRTATKGIDPWKNSPDTIRRSLLLDRVPLGTPVPETLLLGSEGIACSERKAAGHEGRFDCWAFAIPENIDRWSIQLRFGKDQKLANAEVSILK
jgi:hypothetical protein